MDIETFIRTAIDEGLAEISFSVLQELRNETAETIGQLAGLDKSNKAKEAKAGEWGKRLDQAYAERTDQEVYQEGDCYVTNFGLNVDDEAVQTIYNVLVAGNFEDDGPPFQKPGEMVWDDNITGRHLSEAQSARRVPEHWGHNPNSPTSIGENAIRKACGADPDYAQARSVLEQKLRSRIGGIKWV